MTAHPDVVWRGAEALRPFLVPIDELEPFPGNPRRGDIDELRASLRRFGQVLPVLVDPSLGDGASRIVARHHLRLAAKEEGWTHLAVIPNDFGDEDEARAYMLADNRLPELGGYDDAALVDHLRHLDELDALAGTGYSRDERLARLHAAHDDGGGGTGGGGPPGLPRTLEEIVLLFSREQREQAEVWLRIVAKERGTDGPSETWYEALRLAAEQLNG